MLNISNVGKLSKVYKNHSVRDTNITVLDVAGISGRHIMKVSCSYFISDGKEKKISATFSNAYGQQPSTTENEAGTEMSLSWLVCLQRTLNLACLMISINQMR